MELNKTSTVGDDLLKYTEQILKELDEKERKKKEANKAIAKGCGAFVGIFLAAWIAQWAVNYVFETNFGYWKVFAAMILLNMASSQIRKTFRPAKKGEDE